MGNKLHTGASTTRKVDMLQTGAHPRIHPPCQTHTLAVDKPSSQTYTHTHTQHTHMVAHTEKTVCEIISNMHMSQRVLTGRPSHIGRGGSHAAEQNTYTRRYTHASTTAES